MTVFNLTLNSLCVWLCSGKLNIGVCPFDETTLLIRRHYSSPSLCVVDGPKGSSNVSQVPESWWDRVDRGAPLSSETWEGRRFCSGVCAPRRDRWQSSRFDSSYPCSFPLTEISHPYVHWKRSRRKRLGYPRPLREWSGAVIPCAPSEGREGLGPTPPAGREVGVFHPESGCGKGNTKNKHFLMCLLTHWCLLVFLFF